MEEVPHKKYLNDFFQGRTAGSVSRGELYNEDPVTGDARFCGTTASMCGVECAGFEQDEAKMEMAVRKDLMLHAYMFTQSGIPLLYSGDEVGQVNDYTYKEDPIRLRIPDISTEESSAGSGGSDPGSVQRAGEDFWRAGTVRDHPQDRGSL